jgi:hypothetical protein
MSDVFQTLIYYAEMAAAMLVWVVMSCFLVAGLEFVLIRLFPSRFGPQASAANAANRPPAQSH